MEFVAIDFVTTGYEAGNTNESWQLGLVTRLRFLVTVLLRRFPGLSPAKASVRPCGFGFTT